MTSIKTYLHDGGKVGDGFGNEKLDCGIRAYAIAKEIPYSEAHELFEKAGRKVGRRTGWDVYDKLGIKFTWDRISLKNFIVVHPKGSFYVCKAGHAFAIKDGIVFDNFPQSGRVVIKKWFEVK
jgi:hypothetical protein